MRLRNILLVCLSVGSALILAEYSGRLAMDRLLHRGRLYRYHFRLGWSGIPGARVVRRNAAGGAWAVRINAEGFRGPSTWPAQARRRLLVLGDSFSFGEGVEERERFDSLIAAERPGWAFVNLGMSGYGTDQEVLAGRPWFHRLRRGDVVILQTFFNDFRDILKRTASLRAKPWFELKDGRLVEHPPRVGWMEKLRDRSYLLAALGSAMEGLRGRPKSSPAESEASRALYRALVLSVSNELLPRRVHFILAYHGEERPEFLQVFQDLCGRRGIRCVPLDLLLGEDCRFEDGPRHWNAKGHRRVAEGLLRAMDDKPEEMR